MAKALRCVVAVVVGMIVAFVLIIAIELLSEVVHPFPRSFSGTEEEVCQHVARYPRWVLAGVVAAWGATAFVSAWVARWIGGRVPALFVGSLLVVGLVFNDAKLPYVLWFKIVILLAVPAATVLGSGAGPSPTRGEPHSSHRLGLWSMITSGGGIARS